LKRRMVALAAVTLTTLAASACGGDDAGSSEATPEPAPKQADAQLGGVKEYLLEHTQGLTAFTDDFDADAERYYDLAKAADFDYARLWRTQGAEVGPLVQRLKTSWIEGNPMYERVEGIVAGTPSLSKYDVILDAGSSAAEDPESAVPFDLTLPSGTVLPQPGNLYNLTEGALWGTLPKELPPSAAADLDRDGNTEFGEALPDANLLSAASDEFKRSAQQLHQSASEWQPTQSDAFTALVVMVPTMSEYFGQWKESRFVVGNRTDSESFNVVSRLSDINDILTGLDVIYAGVKPRIAESDAARARQTERELDGLKSFISDLHRREQSGKRFTPEEADVLGTEAQDRGTAIAGQVSQAAASLGIEIAQ
jgi:Imelysin